MIFGLMAETSSEAVEFDDIKCTLEKKLNDIFHNESIVGELLNRILLSIVKEEDLGKLKNELDVKLQISVDKYLKGLHLYCYRYALQLISDHDLANDIAQDSLLELFRKPEDVAYIKGWLKSIVYNKAQKIRKDLKRDTEMLGELDTQQDSFQDMSIISDEELSKKLPIDTIRNLLEKDEFKRFEEIISYKTLKEYSQAKGISYDMAKKQNYIIRKNLKAAYLNSQGWIRRPESLKYKQFRNIRRFMKRIVEYSNKGEIEKLSRHIVEINQEIVSKVVSHLTQVSDWGISFTENNIYDLSIVDFTDMSHLVNLHIRVPESGIIKIVSARLLKCGGRAPDPKGKKLPYDSTGKIPMTFEELKKYLAE